MPRRAAVGSVHACSSTCSPSPPRRGYRRVSLETGSQEFFRPARTLYAKYGFRECGPFGDYRLDPNSVFMTLELEPRPALRHDERPDRSARSGRFVVG